MASVRHRHHQCRTGELHPSRDARSHYMHTPSMRVALRFRIEKRNFLRVSRSRVVCSTADGLLTPHYRNSDTSALRVESFGCFIAFYLLQFLQFHVGINVHHICAVCT